MNVNSVQNSGSTDLARKIMTYQSDSNVQFNSSLLEFIGGSNSRSQNGKNVSVNKTDRSGNRGDPKEGANGRNSERIDSRAKESKGYERRIDAGDKHDRVTSEASLKGDSVSVGTADSRRAQTTGGSMRADQPNQSSRGIWSEISNEGVKGQTDEKGIAEKAIDAHAKATRVNNVTVSTKNSIPFFKEVNLLRNDSNVGKQQANKIAPSNFNDSQNNGIAKEGSANAPNAQTSATVGVANATNKIPVNGNVGKFLKTVAGGPPSINGGTFQQGINGVNSVGTLGGVESATTVPQSVESSISERISQIQNLLSKTGGSILKLVKGGGGKMSLRLDPPSLGRLQVEVEIAKNVCNARIVTEDPMVKSALMLNITQLRESLESQGLKLEGFSVESQADLGAQNRSGSHQPWDGFSDRERQWLNASERLADFNQNRQSDTTKVNTRPILGGVDLHV